MSDAMAANDKDRQKVAGKKPRGRPRIYTDDARRALLVAEARKTFVELGYRRTTTDIVAARCRISKQTIYSVFPTKADLFRAVVAGHRQMMLELPRPEGEDRPVTEVLQDIFMINLDDKAERERNAFVTFVMRESLQFPELEDVLRQEGIEQSRALLAQWLEDQKGLGKIIAGNSLSEAQMLMDLVFGGVAPVSQVWKSRAQRQEHQRQAIEIFARGLGAD